jgi:hypothetical protein
MQGDDLTIFLFWMALFVTFVLEAVKAETTIKRVGFGACAATILLIGLFWQKIGPAWPSMAANMAVIAKNPMSWFAIFLFIAAIFAFQRPTERKQTARQITARPTKGPWLTSYKIFDLADQDLMQSAVETEAAVEKISREIERIQLERYFLRMSPQYPSAEPSGLNTLAESEAAAVRQKSAQEQARATARARALEDLYEKLVDGRLVAKGFLGGTFQRFK